MKVSTLYKWYAICFLVISGLFLIGCQDISDKKNPDLNEQENINDDFKHIAKAPEAKEKQSIDKVTKVFFDESTFDKPYEAVAIDVENNEVYANPIISRRGLRAQDGILQISDADNVLSILEKYNIQSWDKEYTSDDTETYEDGYSWKLWLQYEDGTVEKHKGKGTNVEKVTPYQFDDFSKELSSFSARHLQNK